ncbi:filamentous hemagglutinin N-terminal domain-containing protein, partial [Amphritea sp.]|uniref:two-partner secretion domain-containing protein n=1 Tax=Amphritea sp. TaxID=1872502 RepID=UPI003D0AAAEC
MEWKLKPLVQVIKAIGATGAGSLMLLNGAHAAVDNFNVSSGSGSISRPDSNTNIVTQKSKVMVASVSRLDLAGNELLQHNAQISGSSVLYKIQDVKASDIQGRIEGNANLKLMVLQNRNGMVFGPNSQVDVNSFVATTLDVDDVAFQSGKLILDGSNSTGVIVNKGLIQAATGGSVALIAGQVDNQGVIIAEKGHVELASGRAVTIDFDGDGLLQLRIDKETIAGSGDAVVNSGVIEAQGGEVFLTAKAAQDVFTRVVNNTGVIRAGKVSNEGGVIRLLGTGGDTINSGSLMATSADGKGGDVDVLGDRVALTDNAVIDASGKTGGGKVRIGGDFQGKNPEITNASDTFVGKHVEIKADATGNGDGGRVIVWADNNTRYHGQISAQGEGERGDGGFSEVSGKKALDFTGRVDLSAKHGNKGQLLLDPQNLTVGDIPGLSTPDDFLFGGASSLIDNDTIINLVGTTDLILQASDDITVDSAISIGTISSLTLEAGDDIYINSTITNGGSGSLNFIAGSLAVTPVFPDGNPQINLGANITNMGTQNYSGDVVLTADSKLKADTIIFNNRVDGGYKLRLIGDTIFSENVGERESLSRITISNAATLAVDISASFLNFMDNLTLSDNVTLTGDVTAQSVRGPFNLNIEGASGNAVFSGALNVNDLLVSQDAIFASTVSANTIAVSGNAEIIDVVSAESLVINGSTTLGANVTTLGGQTYGREVTLTSDSKLTASSVDFIGTVDGAHKLRLNADVNFLADVGSTESLSRITLSKAAYVGGDLSADYLNFMDSLTLTNDVTLTGGVSTQAINGPFSLTIDGTADLNGFVDLKSLDVLVNSQILSGIHTTGTQNYAGLMILGDDVVLSGSTVTTGQVLGSYDFTIDGAADIRGAIDANSVLVTGTSNLGANITTLTDQTYIGAVTLTGDAVLTGSALNFNDSINGAHRLELDAPVVSLAQDIGATQALSGIVFDQAVVLGVDINAGTQTFRDSLSLIDNITLSGDVTAQTVTGPFNLT